MTVTDHQPATLAEIDAALTDATRTWHTASTPEAAASALRYLDKLLDLRSATVFEQELACWPV